MKQYLCIDLKCFYASVECILRDYDPFTVLLAVCDTSRGNGAICLAVSPALKNLGVSSRSRLYDIDSNIRKQVVFVKPRMKKYIEYASLVYECYLNLFSSSDIHVYSIDEVFIDITSYLSYYKVTSTELGLMVINSVYDNLGLTCCCGVGDNMFLAKVSLDILAKHTDNGVAYLNEKLFNEKLGNHKPLTDFWSIGVGIERRLNNLGCFCINDIVSIGQDAIINEFGIIGYELYQHSLGRDDAQIKDMKDYKPINKSISSSQILFRDYTKDEASVVVLEMLDTLILKLISLGLKTKSVSFMIGYSKDKAKPFGRSFSLDSYTNSYSLISKRVKSIYFKEVEDLLIRKISFSFGSLCSDKLGQLELFGYNNEEEVELYKTISEIKYKYGKNSVNKALSLTEEGTQIMRNKLVGGHNGE